MVAITVTPASVSLVSGDTQKGIAGEAITVGMMVYYNDIDGRWWKAKGNGNAAEAGASNVGMAYSTALAAGQQLSVILPGAIVNMGAGGITAGANYYLSGSTAGGFGLEADVPTTGMRKTHCAMGVGVNQLMLTRVYNGGSVLP